MNNIFRQFRSSLPATFLGVFCVMLAMPARSEPHWLDVRLVERQTGRPVADAAVCLGTRARADQLGAYRSDGNGAVRFSDVAPHPLVLTVSGAGFRGYRQLLEPLYENRVVVVKLVTGGGGPVCDAPARAGSGQPVSGLALETVNIRSGSGANGVLVAARASGPVNQIRISEREDFRGAQWRPYKTEVPFTFSPGQGARQLYVQVRRIVESEGAMLEVLSPVKKLTWRQP